MGHILQNRHEYGPLNETMRLLKQVNKTTSLIPYERLYIQTLHQAGKLIPVAVQLTTNAHSPQDRHLAAPGMTKFAF